MSSDNVRAVIAVTGLVQGVFYRSSTAEEGLRLGLTGWAKNLPNGSVKVVAEGKKETLLQLIEWCKKGSPSAKVASVNVEWQDYKGEFDTFFVKR